MRAQSVTKRAGRCKPCPVYQASKVLAGNNTMKNKIEKHTAFRITVLMAIAILTVSIPIASSEEVVVVLDSTEIASMLQSVEHIDSTGGRITHKSCLVHQSN